jgi:hypothetical protein
MFKKLFGKKLEDKVLIPVSTTQDHIYTKIYDSLKLKLLPLSFEEETPFENFVIFKRGQLTIEWIYAFRDNYVVFYISKRFKNRYIEIYLPLSDDTSGLENKIITTLNDFLAENQ